MKLSTTILLPLVFAATAGTAMAQSAPLTRAQVQAELAEAVRTGDLLADTERGLKLNELYPSNYPAQPSQVGKTRAQVKAELAEAVRTGDLVADIETGLKLNQINPSNYPAQQTQMGKTRAQVMAETAEARRLGLLDVSENEYPKIATPEQVEQIRQAGLRAADSMNVGQLNRQ
ncbi:hypothetical protein BSY239_2664 [Hydrogenophaga sp. RAC07]|uniref:DUF4148 domain-containing protein n=1 Tax=Hydrogenophaga sp. RAC07 TaxID=1842537 RepID=UPI00083D683F|nr:DUF4148 domain-containing protein [Hydrogenophaga sp. RAC07]AOF86033.1 hypothetical protein BSY239_2664 [Hydrogenophaga sp. RAC07]